MSSSSLRHFAIISSCVGLMVASPSTADALVKAGTYPADFTIHDVDDRPISTGTFRGKPMLIVYEDKDAGTQNQGFKDKLGEAAKGSDLAKKVSLVAVADVKSWNFWPAKGYVKDELKKQIKKVGVPIYADWHANGRTELEAKSNVSNIVLLDKTGRVVWSSAGKLNQAQEDRLLELLKAQAAE